MSLLKFSPYSQFLSLLYLPFGRSLNAVVQLRWDYFVSVHYEKNKCILMLHRDCSSMCDWRVVLKLRCSNSWLERHTPPPRSEQLRAAEKGEGSAWMQSQSQRHEAQLHFGLVPVYRKILNNTERKFTYKGFFLAVFGKNVKYSKWEIRNAH